MFILTLSEPEGILRLGEETCRMTIGLSVSCEVGVGEARTDWQQETLRRVCWWILLSKLLRTLVSEFIELQKVELDLGRNGKMQPAELQTKLLHLYSQYATEWTAFSARCHCDVRKRIA
jgi:hypothetical protein